MVLLRWIVGFIIALGVAGFAVLNRQPVDFAFSPVHPSIQLPLYITALAFMGVGFLCGAIMVWLNAAPQRSTSRKQRRQIKALEKELVGANKNAVKDEPPSDFFPALANRALSKKSIL